ncbi:MAG: cell wall-binding repeat-containing protein [bacterium]|nr:cell wall-binding repeat-containing protein [bacterium]
MAKNKIFLNAFLAALLICSLFMFSPTAGAENTVRRIYGETRFETAVEISKKGWNSANTVILARADKFFDALTGTPVFVNSKVVHVTVEKRSTYLVGFSHDIVSSNR